VVPPVISCLASTGRIEALNSGLFPAIDDMSTWAQPLTYLTSVYAFIEVVRMILLKGTGWAQPLTASGYAVASHSLAGWRDRKRG
jgi:ABC-2 type transport system permease protein